MRRTTPVLAVSLLFVALIVLGATPGLGPDEAGADHRPVELLHRDARSGAAGPPRQVLPVDDVRLPRGHHPRRPALAGRRARHALGELARPQALDLPPPQGRQVPQRRRPDVGGREVQPRARQRQALHHRLRGPAAHADPGHRDAGARPRGDRHQGADPHHPDLSLARRSPPRAWCCRRSTSRPTATTSSRASRSAAAPTSSWSR